MSDLIRDVAKKEHGTVVSLTGEIDLHHSPGLHKHLADLCAENPKRLILNLTDVNYIDSSGIGSLVEIFRRMKKTDGSLVLVAPSERVRSVLEITRLDKFFLIAASEEEAAQL